MIKRMKKKKKRERRKENTFYSQKFQVAHLWNNSVLQYKRKKKIE